MLTGEVAVAAVALATSKRGARGKTKGDPNRLATTMGAGLGARSCNLGNCCCCACCGQLSRSVFLLLTMISSLRKLILNFMLRSTFSSGSVVFTRALARELLARCRATDCWSSDTARPPIAGLSVKLTGMQVPSRLTRIITETRAGSGLGGGVPSSSS